jgi:two-component system CheB/CheR fusion protein
MSPKPSAHRTRTRRATAAKAPAAEPSARSEVVAPAGVRATAPAAGEGRFGERRCPVVAIGASAGGLEAISELLGAAGEEPGVAFVVIQHLAPSHQSLLTEILSRATALPVRLAENGLLIEAGHVYVIPPDRDMTVAEGRLRLVKRVQDVQPHHPIDLFFHSLAKECTNKAIGVVLSGTSTDGTAGLRAIKTSGGITFAQDEVSAKYSEMPRNAVASGAVDFVLRPSDIAAELRRLRDHAYVVDATRDGEPLPVEDVACFDEVLQILRAAYGTDFTQYKPSTIRRRILRRMALVRVERLDEYVRVLRESRSEIDALYGDVLINVTSFFRDPGAFTTVARRVLPSILPKPSATAKVRIWVPGCSTGEEVYSLAMCVFEHLGKSSRVAQVQIFGSDVSEVVVARARAGRYPASIASDVSAERLRRFFVRTPEGFQVGKALRGACIFARHDLLKDPPFSKIDFVSCRNVLIYFGPMLQRRAISTFHYALRPDGFLMLGSSENIAAFTDLFTLLDKRHKIYAKRAIPNRLVFGPLASEGPLPSLPEPNAKLVDAPALDVQREADRVLMSRYVPAGVIVDENLDILEFRGHTGAYLEPRAGHASLNLMKMAREGLVLALRSAFQRARREGVSIRRERVRMKGDHGTVEVSIDVVPFASRQTRRRLFLVLFDSMPPRKGASRERVKRSGSAESGTTTTEQELAATKDYLQTIIEEQEATNEELTSANEEILSSNEELQSTNEELETAKEELQSSNEELSTVNDELQNRNGELSDVNNDLTNLLAVIHLPMVILDVDLRLRRATPAAERLLNLIPSDVGRRVTDVRPNVEIPELETIVREVVETVEPKRVDVQDKKGRSYAMIVRPYKTRAQRVEGVVVTWELHPKERPSGSPTLRGATSAMLSAIPTPAAFVDSALRVEARNERWQAAFPHPPDDDPAAWGCAPLFEAIHAVASGGPPVEGLDVECTLGVAASRRLQVAIARVEADDGEGPRLLLIVRETPPPGDR